jgi:hypothetical protein
MDRTQYIEWCKDRAREYLDAGQLSDALASMISDMNQRKDTQVSSYLATFGLSCVMRNDTEAVRRFISGFR